MSLVLNELSKINLVDVVLPTSAGVEIRKRCVTRPTEHQEILLQYLGLRIPLQGSVCCLGVAVFQLGATFLLIFGNFLHFSLKGNARVARLPS